MQKVSVLWNCVVTNSVPAAFASIHGQCWKSFINVSIIFLDSSCRRMWYSCLALAAEPVPLLDAFEFPGAELPAPPPLVPEAPMPLTGVQKGLSLMNSVTVARYCANVRVASLLNRDRRAIKSQFQDLILEDVVKNEELSRATAK